MFASQFLIPALQRVVATISMMVHKSLLVAGVLFVFGLAGTYHGHSGLLDGLRAMFPAGLGAAESPQVVQENVQPVALNEDKLLPTRVRQLFLQVIDSHDYVFKKVYYNRAYCCALSVFQLHAA